MQQTTKRFDVGGVMLAQPFKAVRLGHVGLWHSELPRMLSTFVDLFGLRQTDQILGAGGKLGAGTDLLGFFTTCNTDHHALVAIDPSTADPLRRRYYEAGVTLNQLSFQVNTLREINDAHAYFTSHGVTISKIGRDQPGSNWAVYGFDPDGHRVELFYGMEQIGWNITSKPSTMYRPIPHELIALPQPAECVEVDKAIDDRIDLNSGFRRNAALPYRYDVGGVMLQRPFKVARVGPVRLFVADVDAAERFYTSIIGLQRTEEVVYRGFRCVFLRTGAEHHSVALFPNGLRPLLDLNANTTLANIGLQVQSYQQLKHARAFLRDNGLSEVEMPPELHPGVEYAATFCVDGVHCFQLYFQMDQLGWDGRVRPVARSGQREPWPERIEGTNTSYMDQLRQGPVG